MLRSLKFEVDKDSCSGCPLRDFQGGRYGCSAVDSGRLAALPRGSAYRPDWCPYPETTMFVVSPVVEKSRKDSENGRRD